ncbi:MAG TPA: amidohydrolase family protein, partial [Longimicrobiales bacterium]
GPRMYITGPYINGDAYGYMTEIDGTDDARRVVRYWAEEGVDWMKAYTTIGHDELAAAIDEAHRQGIRMTGHLCSVSFREAVALGIDNLEHGLFTNSDYVEGKERGVCPDGVDESILALDMNSAEVQRTFRDMVEGDVPMTSTLAIYELYVPGRPDPIDPRTLEAMSDEARTEYLRTRQQIADNAENNRFADVFRQAQAFELAFARAGGLLGAGVDPTGYGGALPGFGDQRNYELLIEAGFSPVEAIEIMTLNGAKILGQESEFGSIEAGKAADLVVIDGDPIARPAEIRNVVTVFRAGVGYDPDALIASVRGAVGLR